MFYRFQHILNRQNEKNLLKNQGHLSENTLQHIHQHNYFFKELYHFDKMYNNLFKIHNSNKNYYMISIHYLICSIKTYITFLKHTTLYFYVRQLINYIQCNYLIILYKLRIVYNISNIHHQNLDNILNRIIFCTINFLYPIKYLFHTDYIIYSQYIFHTQEDILDTNYHTHNSREDIHQHKYALKLKTLFCMLYIHHYHKKCSS